MIQSSYNKHISYNHHANHYFVTQIWVANHRLINAFLEQDLPVSVILYG